MNIEWKEINPGYIISSDGRVASRKNGNVHILKPYVRRDGYAMVRISKGGTRSNRYVHRLVAEFFLPDQPTPRHEINHKNGEKADNRDANLEWVTSSENKLHKFRVLGCVNKGHLGTDNGNAKLTEPTVREIRDRARNGDRQIHLAKEYAVSQQLISRIVVRKAWGWLSD